MATKKKTIAQRQLENTIGTVTGVVGLGVVEGTVAGAGFHGPTATVMRNVPTIGGLGLLGSVANMSAGEGHRHQHRGAKRRQRK